MRAIYHCQLCGALAGELHRDGCEADAPLWKPPVPEPDQCPECRAAPEDDHAQGCELASDPRRDCPGCSPVNVPLPLQERLLEAYLLDEWTVAVAAFMERHRDRIVDMAFARLRDGYGTYGSAMYGWKSERRTDEALQEVSDLLAYLSSGEVE